MNDVFRTEAAASPDFVASVEAALVELVRNADAVSSLSTSSARNMKSSQTIAASSRSLCQSQLPADEGLFDSYWQKLNGSENSQIGKIEK